MKKPTTAASRAGTSRAAPASNQGLVGRGFHTIKDNGRTEWQGQVMADLGTGYYLVQLFDWLVGDASTQHVMPISEFASKTPEGMPRFRFFNSLKDANDYMDTWGRARDQRIDERKNASEE